MRQRSRKKPISLSNSRWLLYAATGAATAVTGAPSAEGEIHYSDHIGLRFNIKETGKPGKRRVFRLKSGIFLSFNQSAFGSGITGINDLFAIHGGVSNGIRGDPKTLGTSRYASNLNEGALVSQGPFLDLGPFRNAYLVNFYGMGYFTGPGEAFAGFRFNVGNGTQYGWIRFRLGNFLTGAYTVVDLAWADPAEQIAAGQTSSEPKQTSVVPASGSLGLLALGSAGLIAWRQSRQESPGPNE